MYLHPYKQNLLNFRHHFLFGVSSKISSFWYYFRDNALNILFKFVCRLRNVSKKKHFEFSYNLKWYIIRISFERVLRNIQKNLLLIYIMWKFRIDRDTTTWNIQGELRAKLGTSKFSLYFQEVASLSIWSFLIIGSTYNGTDRSKKSGWVW
jgi:hypothetical protein